MSGRQASMSMSGAESSAEIHPTRNCRTYGFKMVMRSRSMGANARTSNEPLSATMSFTSLSRRCAAFCTSASASALSLQSASKVTGKKGRKPRRDTLATLYMASHA